MIVVMRRRKITSEQTALERQDLPCMYLAHHESASVLFIIITIKLMVRTVHNRPLSGTTANEFDTMHCRTHTRINGNVTRNPCAIPCAILVLINSAGTGYTYTSSMLRQ